MTQLKMAVDEIGRRGREIYESQIRSQVEIPENVGKQLVIDVETGDFEIGTEQDGLAASRRLMAKHPDAALYSIRIGYNAVHAIGGALTRTST